MFNYRQSENHSEARSVSNLIANAFSIINIPHIQEIRIGYTLIHVSGAQKKGTKAKTKNQTMIEQRKADISIDKSVKCVTGWAGVSENDLRSRPPLAHTIIIIITLFEVWPRARSTFHSYRGLLCATFLLLLGTVLLLCIYCVVDQYEFSKLIQSCCY